MWKLHVHHSCVFSFHARACVSGRDASSRAAPSMFWIATWGLAVPLRPHLPWDSQTLAQEPEIPMVVFMGKKHA
eukprot:gene9230-9308_t